MWARPLKMFTSHPYYSVISQGHPNLLSYVCNYHSESRLMHIGLWNLAMDSGYGMGSNPEQLLCAFIKAGAFIYTARFCIIASLFIVWEIHGFRKCGGKRPSVNMDGCPGRLNASYNPSQKMTQQDPRHGSCQHLNYGPVLGISRTLVYGFPEMLRSPTSRRMFCSHIVPLI